jgi:WD40 repeat protein
MEAKPDMAPAAQAEKADAPTEPLPAGAVRRLGSTGLRHGTSVAQLALSPDGTKVAAYGGGQLSLWDTRTGGAVRRVELPKQAVSLQASLVWLADGRGIVMLQGADTRDVARFRGSDGLVWEFTDDKAVPKIPSDWATPLGMKGAAPDDIESDWCYAVSPDGTTLAVGRGSPLAMDIGIFSPLRVGTGENLDKERAILLRPLKTGAAVSALPAAKELARLPGNCKALLFTPDGKRLVALRLVKDGHQVTVWDLASGKETARFKAPRPTESYRGGALAVSDTTLAMALEGGDTILWDLATGKERKLDTHHVTKASPESTGTLAVAFAPDGKTLATSGRDGLVKLWDVASDRHLRTLEQQYAHVETLAWSRDGRTVAFAARDGEIRLWDAATGQEVCPQPGHHGGVFRTVLSPDGKIAVTAAWDRTVRCWDAATGRELRVLAGLVKGIKGGSPPDGSREQHVVAGLVNELAVSPDSRTVLASFPEGRLRMWDLATGRETTPADLPDRLRFGAFTFTPDGRRLITASGPRVTVLDWPVLKVRRSFDLPKPDKQPKEYECLRLAVSPDSRWLATVAERSGWRAENPPSPAGGVIDLWDLGTGQQHPPPGRVVQTRLALPTGHDGRLHRRRPARRGAGHGDGPRPGRPARAAVRGWGGTAGPADPALGAVIRLDELLLHGGDRRLARRPHPVRLLRHELHRRLRGGHGEAAAHARRTRRLRALAGHGCGRPAAPLRQRRRVRLAVGHDAGRGREAAEGAAHRGGRGRLVDETGW